jgi:hypothetical protein
MIWKDIKGWKGDYQVNRKGQVKSLSRLKRLFVQGNEVWFLTKERLLKPYLGSDGYRYYFLSSKKRNKTAHLSRARLIGTYFIPNPKRKKEINHKNCNRTDDRIGNLEWVTRTENTHHSIKNSAYTILLPGEKNPSAKLTELQIKAIRKDNRVHRLIAEDYNVCRENISLIKRNARWKHV